MNDGSAFEKRVATALQALSVFSGPNARMFRNKVYPGAKDRRGYEIDISFELTLTEGLSVLVIVECKAYTRPVDRDVVQKILQVRDDIAAHKAIVISSHGFRTGAVRLARANGVALWQFVDRRFIHVSHHMSSLRDNRRVAGLVLSGLRRYLANRGIVLDVRALSAEEVLRGSDGLALCEVDLVWSDDPETPMVSPPCSETGLAIYETPYADELGEIFAFHVIEAILQSGTDEAIVLRAHIRISRDQWTSGPEYARLVDSMCNRPSGEDVRHPLRGIDLRPRRRQEVEMEREAQLLKVNAEDTNLRLFLKERGEID
jgi:hypothetical protein